MLEFRPAQRRAVPMLIGLSGPSGSGKTLSSLLLASGIAGDQGRVGILDTENGRGEMYEDSEIVRKALPGGFDYARLDPPFEPKYYTEAINIAEQSGITVLVVDSGSHVWEGVGGCEEIAEEKAIKGQPNWKLAKILHRRFVVRCLSSKMHIIFCLRAREKVNYRKNSKGKTEVIPLGIQPICEKNFMFEMLVSMRIEENTHHAKPVKVPEPLKHLFREDVLITKSLGERLREWNESGVTQSEYDRLRTLAIEHSANGVTAYKEFFSGLTNQEKQWLVDNGHEEYKMLAEQADAAAEGNSDGTPTKPANV